MDLDADRYKPLSARVAGRRKLDRGHDFGLQGVEFGVFGGSEHSLARDAQSQPHLFVRRLRELRARHSRCATPRLPARKPNLRAARWEREGLRAIAKTAWRANRRSR